MLFALIAGAGTAITPCVLPVLPALLSASGIGGRRRPLGIVVGLGVTFTIAIVVVAQLVKGVGLANGATRTLAVVVLIAFGIVLMVPEIAERVQAPLSRLARLGPKSRGTGFVSGLGVGGALGFVCAPCAGPILAAVTSVSASNGASAKIVAVAISYSIGLSTVLLLYALGSRILIEKIRKRARGHLVERTLGIILIVTGIAMAANLDVRFEEALAKATVNSKGQSSGLLSFLVDPTKSLENSTAVQKRLASLRPTSRFLERQRKEKVHVAVTDTPGVAIAGVQTPSLPNLGQALEFTGTEQWFNTSGGRPLSLAGLRGKVVLVDFWTYTCINCIRTLPFVEGLYKDYHQSGLEIVGVETPEFAFEREAGNVRQAIQSDGLTYPVVQDNNYGTWNAYQNQYWPAEYLIDAQGNVRHTQFGEGNYKEDEAAVRALLVAAGAKSLPAPMTAHAIMPSASLGTPETYLDPHRAQGFAVQPVSGTHTYPAAGSLQPNEFALTGRWTVSSESITPAGLPAQISGHVQAADVYLVMTSAGNTPRNVSVVLDGRPIAPSQAGADVHGGEVTVRGQRLYSLVRLPRDEGHTFTVTLPPGVSAYDFTFG